MFDTVVARRAALHPMESAAGVSQIALHLLMDRDLPALDREGTVGVATAHPEVRGVYDFYTRSAGGTKLIRLLMELDPALSFVGSHAVGDRIEAHIAEKAFPGAEMILHVDALGVKERHPRDLAV